MPCLTFAMRLAFLHNAVLGALANVDVIDTKEEDVLRHQLEAMAKFNLDTKEQMGRLAQQVHSLQHEIQESKIKERRLEAYSQPLDTIWLILCGALVMFMQAGFAMLEAGCCRAKNVQHILLKNFTDVCIGTLGWFFCGYTFAYRGKMDDGKLENGFIGTESFFGVGFSTSTDDGVRAANSAGDYSLYLHWFFQWAFCTAAATIVSGGVAERINVKGYIMYSFLMTAFIYPVVVAWTWGYGWIANKVNDVGYIDFAGSGVVHMTGGVAALVGAIIAGSRKDRWTSPEEFIPHSLPLVVLGTFILWFGWYGFNCGSTLSMKSDNDAAKAALVAMNTTTAAATGGITVLALQFLITRKYDLGALCNGILAGLVSITAPCSNVDIGSAIAIGLLGGFVFIGASYLLKRLHIDDPIDAFAVHGACGAWGVLSAALFDWGEGFKYANGWSGFTCVTDDDGCDPNGWSKTFAANVVEIVMVVIWSGGLSGIVFANLRFLGLLRLGDDEQDRGADEQSHSQESAYVMKTPSLDSKKGSQSSK